MKSENAIYTGFEFEVDGHPALAIINSDLKKLEERDKYPFSVFILLVPDGVNENGHPDEEEYDYLNEAEKKIINYLEHYTQSLHVGHTTMYKAREIIFYTANRDEVEMFLQNFLPTVEREHDFEIERDPQWNNVSAFYDLL